MGDKSASGIVVTKVKQRKIRIVVSATGRGLKRESVDLELRPIEDERAMQLYRRITAAIQAVLDAPFPPRPKTPADVE